MVDYSENFYAGADYGLDSDYASDFSVGMDEGYKIPAGAIGLPSDPRTANQLKAVSDRLNTGAKTIEVGGIQAGTWETVPDYHIDELSRLRKLTGSELTFHGPLIEPTGVSKQGWNETHRAQAERQMFQSVERAHKMDPEGNLVVTFHTSNGLPDPETRVMEEFVDPKTGEKTMKETIKEFGTVSYDGRFDFKSVTPDYFRGKDEGYRPIEEQENAIKDAIDKQNKDAWFRQLQHLSFNAYSGTMTVKGALRGKELDPEVKEKTDEKQWLKIYADYMGGKPKSKILEAVGPYKDIVEKQITDIAHGDIYLRDAYQDLQTMYNQAYEIAKKDDNKDDLAKLEKFRGELSGSVKDIENPEKVEQFGDMLLRGVNLLRSIKPPQLVKPLREFAVDKSSETFANIAFESYKKFGDTAPVIAVENPPVGMGLAHARDVKDVVVESRNYLKKRLVEDEGLSESEAKKQAEKLLGATWDVGHINMLRKQGYEDEEIIRQTKEIAPYVKKVHLSDNFGMEHTELPMGMGNVPTKQMLEMIKKYGKQVEKLKYIQETGNWFGPQAFGNRTPFVETLKSFGSPIYSMKMGPYWNQAAGASGGYFAGYGQTLPEHHFGLYGAGFSGLPAELGGQGGGRSRVGGTPME